MKNIIVFLVGFCVLGLLPTTPALAQAATDVNCDGCVNTNDIADRAVRRSKIANFAVNTPKLSNFAVTSAKIKSLAVTESKIADGAVTNAKLVDNHSLDASDGSPVDAVSVDTLGNVTMTGSLNVPGSNSIFREIFTTELQVEGPGGSSQSGKVEIRNDGNGGSLWARSLIIFDNNGSSVFQVELDGDVIAKSYTTPSDQRLKTNIQDIGAPLEKVMDLRGVSFDWRDDVTNTGDSATKRNIGFLAQEVDEVFPEVVRESSGGTLSVEYSALIPVLVEAMKQQQRQIDRLATELEILSGER